MLFSAFQVAIIVSRFIDDVNYLVKCDSS